MSNENEVPTACNSRIAMGINKQSCFFMWNQISPNRNITKLELLCVNRFNYCEMTGHVW